MFQEDKLVDILENGQEIVIFFMIEQIGAFCFYMNHDMADGRIPEHQHAAIDADIASAQSQQVRLVKSLDRFGASLVDDQGKPSEEYWKWYRKWKNYTTSLSNDEFERLDKAISNGDDLSDWKPVEG